MQKEDGETEIAFIYSLFLWILCAAAGWLVLNLYDDWINNIPIEFTSRSMRLYNGLPDYMKLGVFIGGFLFCLVWSIHQTIKFVRLIRT